MAPRGGPCTLERVRCANALLMHANPNPDPTPNPTPNPNQVHGFAASCEQWERLAYALRQQASPQELPPVWAVDMLGFGHTEKPGLSYTQHLWEAQVAD